MVSRSNCLLCLLAAAPACAFYKRVYMDWVALNARSTTRHIMRPLSIEGKAECLRLKQELREEVSRGTFVVDAFAAAAAANSLDQESCNNSGLIGRRLKQGVCRDPDLDRACFCSPIGQVDGPIRSAEGYHLVLVEERLGLQMHDNGMARVLPKPSESGGVRSVLAPPDPDEPSELVSPSAILSLLLFVLVTTVGGQVIADLASSVDLEKMANSMN